MPVEDRSVLVGYVAAAEAEVVNELQGMHPKLVSQSEQVDEGGARRAIHQAGEAVLATQQAVVDLLVGGHAHTALDPILEHLTVA